MARFPDALPMAGAGPARLIPYRELAPAANMAVDEAIMHLALRPTLRFYGWDPPGISLGRFQKPGKELRLLQRAGLPAVRRMTGGGAIVHWHELTYSLCLPLDHPLIADITARESYRVLHGPILLVLHELGIAAEARPGAEPDPPDGGRPFLCFDRATELDLVVAGKKLLGSAQRRARGRLLQHGSLILAPNRLQPGTAALSELQGGQPDPADLAHRLARSFEGMLGPLEAGELSVEEASHAEKVAEQYTLR